MESVKKTERVQDKNLKPFKKGQSGNENGRPKGQRNYATLYWEAMKKIAESKDMTPEQLEVILLESGLNEAFKGNFAFYRDNWDRKFGKAAQPLGSIDEEGEFKEQEFVVRLVKNGN